MAWDTTLPANDEKLRDLGTAIRPNWEAIEDADSTFKPVAFNFNNRTPLAVTNNPTALSDAYLLYCKDDSAGNAELFGIDENSVITQFSSTDRSLAQSGYVLLPPGFLLQWGQATILAGGNTIAITFPKEFGATPYSITSTPHGSVSSDTFRGFGNSSITSSGFTAESFNATYAGNTDVSWIAIGPV